MYGVHDILGALGVLRIIPGLDVVDFKITADNGSLSQLSVDTTTTPPQIYY